MKNNLWNPIFDQKCYVVLDEHGCVLCEQLADSSHLALKAAKTETPYARTAILKIEHEKQQKLVSKWLKAGKRVEG